MSEAFRLGGWGMYPTTIAGLILIYFALRYAAAPDATKNLVVRRLMLLTFLSGCLGFVTGVIKSFTSELSADFSRDVVTGIGESLTNVGLGLVFLVAATIATTVGAARRGDTG